MKGVLVRVWNSPTFTTWGKVGVEALRVLAITPLVLTRFDATEIAAWYLFSSLLVFATVLHVRVSLTFSRMVAFAMGGAEDLSPIAAGEKRGAGQPNWDLMRRVYTTVGGLNLVTAVLAGLSGTVMGAFSLGGLLTRYPDPGKIWTALVIVLVSQSIIMGASRYEIMLNGMNFVALTNRWAVLFAFLSSLAGVIAVSLGAGIVLLALVMQSVQAVSVLCLKFVANRVHGGRLQGGRGPGFDVQVFRWAWPAFWRGMCSSLAATGILQFASIVYARVATADAAASYLFSLRMLQVATQFSEAPLLSHAPRMSRLLATGGVAELRQLVCRKARQSQLLLALACLVLGVIGPVVLKLIRANAEFLPAGGWALLTSFYIAHRYLLIGLRLPAMSNQIVCFKQEIAAALVSATSLIIFVPRFGFPALVLAVFLPPLLIVNLRPFVVSATILKESLWRYISRTAGWAVLAYSALASLLFLWKRFI